MKKIDIHSHILAGIDDGAKQIEESAKMLQIAAEDGITAIIATPHFHYSRGHAKPEKIRRRLSELRAAAKEQELSIRLYAGNELYYSEDLIRIVKAGEALTMAGSDYVLLEFSENTEQRTIQNGVYEFLSEGYYPIIAHVERYRAFLDNPGFAAEITDLGAYCQINAKSLTSGIMDFGKKRFVNSMIENGLVSFIATDAHDTNQRPSKFGKAAEWLYKKYGPEECRELFFENAKKVLNHQII